MTPLRSSAPTLHNTEIARPRWVDRLPNHISKMVVSTVRVGGPIPTPMVEEGPRMRVAESVRSSLTTPHKYVHHDPPYYKDSRSDHQNDYPRPADARVLWLFGRWSARPGLRSTPCPERIDVSLRLPEEGCSTAYATGVAAVSIIAVVTIDDVLLSFDEGEPATPAGWWCGDIHFLMDSAFPHHVDLKANSGVVLRGDRRCIRVEGVSNRDHSPREDCRRLLQFFGSSPGLRTLTRVNLLGVPKEPEDTHQEREAHCGY